MHIKRTQPEVPVLTSAHAKTIDSYLPLSAVDCHLLLALSRQDLYGYALLQAMAEDSGGTVGMDIGALYRALDRLTRAGLIAKTERLEPEPSRGKPRRYYRLRRLGRSVLDAEMRRLVRVVELAGLVEARP